jgi:hypothetical protein
MIRKNYVKIAHSLEKKLLEGGEITQEDLEAAAEVARNNSSIQNLVRYTRIKAALKGLSQ